MDYRSVGVFVIIAGLCAVVVGILIYVGGLSWFGRLPGDIRIERENLRVFIPITSMLLVSLALSLVLYVLRRWL
jgi:hypothetical protein